MSESKAEHITKLKEILWKYNDITSYRLMAEYMKQGGEYGKPFKFEDLLYSLKAQPDIVYDEENDKYKLYKNINVELWVSSFGKRSNCYGCNFRLELEEEDDATLNKKIACGLNPFIQPRNNVSGLERCECPLNTVLESMKNTEDKL